ncbi:hypothetical protein MCY_00244 [Bartonella rattimassiliensis 15908]|uniref:ABC transporter domain-containing protein n=1 Tax=Bartonella rattimassiliensis 15908 TaxID=1094556 RepID=J1JRR7_9HYPH|nr:hypothetical protein MCY_00244 [Bartonella rattimassiliensis 15908]
MTTLAHAAVLLLDEHTSVFDPRMADFGMRLTEKIVEEKKLTTIMVNHYMRQFLDHGDRTLMLYGGKVILDVCYEECRRLDVNDLISMFQKVCGEVFDDGELLMG